ncbi:MAG: hypothetical protein ACK44D_01660 [Bacteroidia bacterium]
MATVGIKWHKLVHQTLTVRHVNRLAMTDYTLFDSKVLFRYKQLNVFAEASNIFNTKYLEAGFVQMPGRWFKVGFDIKLNYRVF